MGGTSSKTAPLFSSVVYCEELKKATDVALPDLSQLPEEVPSLIQQAEAQARERDRLKNPGVYEHVQNDLKRALTPDNFDGCRFEITKPLGPKFSVSHVLWLGSQQVPGGLYQFGATVVEGTDAQDPGTVLVGRMTPDGRLQAHWNQKLSENILLRVQSQLTNEPGGSHAVCDVDYKGDDFTGNLKVMKGPLFGASYLQSVTKNIVIGGEGYYHSEYMKTILSYCGKYNSDTHAGIVTYQNIGALQLHYMRKLSDRVRLASEFVYNTTSGESTVTTGAEFTLHRSRFLTTIDQTGKISSTLESKISPMLTFLLSAEALHAEGNFKFGYGVQLGQ